MKKITMLYKRYAFFLYDIIHRYSKNRQQRLILYVGLMPIFAVLVALGYLYELLFARLVTELKVIRERKMKFDVKLSATAIVKNEGLYIKEWIEYHKMLGIERFYIYNNESTDNTVEVLQPYIQDGTVILTDLPGRARQMDAYNFALKACRKKTKYLVAFDLDEFMIPIGKWSIYEAADEIFKMDNHTSGVAIPWLVYGSSGHIKKPEGLVTENYWNRGLDSSIQNGIVKVIVNPRFAKGYTNPHIPEFIKGTHAVIENGEYFSGTRVPVEKITHDKLRINHYCCKSKEECQAKFARGMADREVDVNRKWEEFKEFDLNDVYDDSIRPYISKLKEQMKR